MTLILVIIQHLLKFLMEMSINFIFLDNNDKVLHNKNIQKLQNTLLLSTDDDDNNLDATTSNNGKVVVTSVPNINLAIRQYSHFIKLTKATYERA